MSHIHRVLDKAQRDGFVKRTAPVAPAERLVTGHPAPPTPPQPRPVAQPDFAAAPPTAPAPVPNPVVAQVRTADPPAIHPLLVAGIAPDSAGAEQYRALRTRIGHGENGRQYRVLIVTSPTASDGKTLTALNLALTMAQEFHKRVLVVDADLRKGRLHQLLGLPASPGLCEVLTGEATLEEALVSLPAFHLTVLPAGGPTGLPTEMLGSAEMRRALDTAPDAVRPHRVGHAAGCGARRRRRPRADGRRRADGRPGRADQSARHRSRAPRSAPGARAGAGAERRRGPRARVPR